MPTSRKRKSGRNNGKSHKNNGDNGVTKTLIPPKKIENISARTDGQVRYLRSIDKNQITICVGPSGTGKTACAIARGVQFLRNSKFGKIIITRPAVESGENLGFAPGTIGDKFYEYVAHTIDELANWTDQTEKNTWLNERIIEYIPLAYTRGRNYNNSYVILEEAQNCTKSQLKMLLTRLGKGSKMVISGDIDQSDLPNFKQGGLKFICDNLYDIKDINVCNLTTDDIVRNSLIGQILDRFQQ